MGARMRIINFNNRIKKLVVPSPKPDPWYCIHNGHINLIKDDEKNPCVLCGENPYISSSCQKKLDDISLHIFMESHEEMFVLFLPCEYGVTDAESYAETGYTGFMSYPDKKGFNEYSIRDKNDPCRDMNGIMISKRDWDRLKAEWDKMETK
jgi:hypothetical protein